MTEYFSVLDARLVTVARMVVNLSDGYTVKLPGTWGDAVTVKSRLETKEWRFVIYTGSLAESETELLRIKVVAPTDYQDRLETAEYRLMATKGVNQYMAYIPENDFRGTRLPMRSLWTC